jgi:murein DD-endopeptidase MepM/ murein hydrolase activator NlpD
MRVPVLTQTALFLTRGAAVIAIAGAAAGCSSNVMRFQDGIFANSSSSQVSQPQQYAQAQQYPVETAQPAGVDDTYTGSISRQAVQPVNVARQQQRGGHPVPSANVGGQAVAAPASQPFPQPQMAAAPSQPFPGDVQRAGGDGKVVRQQMPAPAASAPARLDQTVTGSIAPKPQVPQPVGQKAADGKTSRVAKSEVPANQLPAPAAPAERLAVLPQGTRISDKPTGQQASAPAAKTSATAGSVYTVQAGDTLSGIARRMGTTTSEIKQINGIDGGLIRIGQKLTIPGAGARQAVAAAKLPEGVDPIVTGSASKPARTTEGTNVAGYTPPAKADKVIEDSIEQAAAAPDATGIGRMRWPARGRVITAFGGQSGGKKNDGIDIAVPEGTPVKAAENGVVIYAGDGLKDFGNTVLVRHEDGLVTVYGHASEITVERGDTVRRGQEIARSGLSGNADAPKLHFEVRKNSTPVDPAKYLE